MDPTQALAEILELLEAAAGGPAPVEVTHKLQDLIHWLNKGGFSPNVLEAIDRAGLAESFA